MTGSIALSPSQIQNINNQTAPEAPSTTGELLGRIFARIDNVNKADFRHTGDNNLIKELMAQVQSEEGVRKTLLTKNVKLEREFSHLTGQTIGTDIHEIASFQFSDGLNSEQKLQQLTTKISQLREENKAIALLNLTLTKKIDEQEAINNYLRVATAPTEQVYVRGWYINL